MYYTQNEKILQVGEENLIVGIDVGSEKHYARAFDWRGMEYTKKAYVFTNDAEGFAGFLTWISLIMEKSEKKPLSQVWSQRDIIGSISLNFFRITE